MPNRNLNADELKRANELLADIRARLIRLADGDPSCSLPIAAKSPRNLDMTNEGSQALAANSKR